MAKRGKYKTVLSNPVKYIEKAKERFKSKIKIDKKTGCHIFQGRVSPKGYGQFIFWNKVEQAHRVSYCLDKGISIESIRGWDILHKCDNPPCCNPKHLFKGKNIDNVNDKIAKGRHMRKLTKQDIADIKILLRSKTQDQIAIKFGVSQGMVSMIKNGNVHSSL